MNKRLWFAGCGLLLLALPGCGRQEAATEGPAAVPVTVVTVVRESVSPTLEYSGGVEPWRKALLGAQISGQVERIHVEVGDHVKKGDLLVELSGEQLTQVGAQFAAVEKDWQRMKSLLERGAVTQQAFDQTNAAYEGAKAQYDLVLASTRISAPFAGVISAKYLEEGEVFTMMPTGAGAPAILELAKIDTVKVMAELSEADRPLVRAGNRASIGVQGHGDRRFAGLVRRVDPNVDAWTRTTAAEIAVPNPGELLRPGMFADLEIELSPRPALLLTRDALVRQEGTAVFYTYAVDGGVAKRCDLRLGDDYGASVEVLDGLSEGDVVVTSGRYRLHDGAAVEIAGSGGGVGGSPEEAGR